MGAFTSVAVLSQRLLNMEFLTALMANLKVERTGRDLESGTTQTFHAPAAMVWLAFDRAAKLVDEGHPGRVNAGAPYATEFIATSVRGLTAAERSYSTTALTPSMRHC